MSKYELVTVISPEIDEGKASEITDKVNRFISERGGVVEETKQWGRKKLAYPIKRFMEADYTLTLFKLESKLVKEFEADLRTSGEILRHLVVKVGEE
ncbi:MAG: 30S ribosomal protein S6 [Dehalococcoidia bacterium]|nr:30S ribosomal protein S6 [Dehalococcoidia bacterium]